MEYSDIYKDYDRKIWITVGSRFAASHRFSFKDRYSVFTISILSLYTIILGILSGFEILSLGLT
jgi:hypothetical protein